MDDTTTLICLVKDEHSITYSVKEHMPVTGKFRASALKSMASRKRAANTAVRLAQRVVRRAMAVSRPFPGQLRALTPEVKALDVPVTTYAINQTAVITSINLVRIGSTFCNRIGRRIEMASLRLTGFINALRTTNDEDYARIMLIYDRQTNGAVPAIADILQTTDQAAANTTTAQSGLNLNNRDRFVVLRDMRILLPAVTVASGVITAPGIVDPIKPQNNIDMFVKLKGLVTQFKADSAPAVIGDIASGGLFLVTYGSAFAAGSEGFNLTAEMRLRFTDN